MRFSFHAMPFLTAYLVCLSLLISGLTAKHDACPPYPFVNLEHGNIARTGPQKYVFSCDTGYFLASPPKVRCYRGNWTSTKEPKCLKKEGQCEDPPSVSHSVIHGTERAIGDTIQYVCEPGFVLLGHGTRICKSSGHWSGRTPTCMDEKEPLEKVAERLKNSFVDEVGTYTVDGPKGRLLDRASLQLGLELVLLIDRSSSVDPVHLKDAKNFMKFLLRRFGVKNDAKNKVGTRAAVITFGTGVQMVFNVDNENITGPMAANRAIDAIEPNGGGTNMEGALTQVILKVKPKLRPQAKRVIFLMTDGEPNIANPEITPQDMARTLKKDHGFEIFAVGIGLGINRLLLSELASKPPLSHLFILSQYPDLNEIMKVIEDDQPPAPTISRDQCGYTAPGEDRPWLAALYVGSGPMKLCGGVLICSRWVLTAASCVLNEQHVNVEDVFVTLGERDLLQDEQSQTNFYAVDIRVHPSFDPKEFLKNNLALVKLNLPASRYRPACLPPTDRPLRMHLDLKINASVAGWGITSSQGVEPANGGSVQFRMASTSALLAEENECPGKRKGVAMFCAGWGKQNCLGMMGSPIVAMDSSTEFNHVIGILHGRSHCYSKGFNQYMELTRHLRWIHQMTDGCHLKHWGIQI